MRTLVLLLALAACGGSGPASELTAAQAPAPTSYVITKALVPWIAAGVWQLPEGGPAPIVVIRRSGDVGMRVDVHATPDHLVPEPVRVEVSDGAITVLAYPDMKRFTARTGASWILRIDAVRPDELAGTLDGEPIVLTRWAPRGAQAGPIEAMAHAQSTVTELNPMWSGDGLVWMVRTQNKTLHVDALTGRATVDRD